MRRHEAQSTLALRLLRKLCAVLCLAIWPFCNVAPAQSITLQLLNGKNGKPITKVKVYISFSGDQARKAIELATDHRGEVQFDAGASKTFQVHQVGYATCDEQPVGSQPRAYLVDKVLETGQVSANDCGSTRLQPEPGRLVFFVRHGTWGEWLKQ
jgi:hypothetical protein